ncbi:MAG: prepilin-type N-terminal cleavage/methylation domain-containing protein [bacterium]|nr:prepilin-type N-terminal cleavage/methylation domain-containing protein [bacterium]
MRRSPGFTLMELMVVVAIIAVLATVIIPNFVHARAQGVTAACESNLRQIATAMELYYADNGSYPQSGSVTPRLFGGGVAPAENYLGQTPIDPASNKPYSLHVTAASGNAPARYVIEDAGGHDPSTTRMLTDRENPGGAGSVEPSATYLVYSSSNGLQSAENPNETP